jgi:LCP family protein required for cell wall assembly
VSRKLRTLLALVVVLLLFVPGGGERKKAPSIPVIELHHTAAASYFDPTTVNPLFVLVIGSDIRSGSPLGGRADSLHIVAINTKTGAGTVVGIPRDSWVPIVGGPTEKINASLVIGGPQAVVATVTRLTGIHFHYWALTEFSHFRRLVDALGGVVVRVPYDMHDQPYSGANFVAGVRHMNGAESLAFARNRHDTPNGDFSRSENQGRLLVAGLAKFRMDAPSPLRLAKYLAMFRSEVLSDVPATELFSLALIARRIDPSKVRNLVLPGGTGDVGGASVVFLSPEANDIFNRIKDDGVL